MSIRIEWAGSETTAHQKGRSLCKSQCLSISRSWPRRSSIKTNNSVWVRVIKLPRSEASCPSSSFRTSSSLTPSNDTTLFTARSQQIRANILDEREVYCRQNSQTKLDMAKGILLLGDRPVPRLTNKSFLAQKVWKIGASDINHQPSDQAKTQLRSNHCSNLITKYSEAMIN